MKFSFSVIFLLSSFSIYSQKPPSFQLTKFDTSTIKGYFLLSANDDLIIADKDVNVIYFRPTKNILSFSLENDGRFYCITDDNLYFMNKSFHLVDSFTCKNNIRLDKHDAIVMPNGNILLLGFEKTVMSYSKAPELKEISKQDESLVPVGLIQEQDAQHNLVWEWHAKDHFDMGDLDLFYEHPESHPDLTHCNAIELDSDGNILLSSRNMNEITKINKSDGSVMWRLGGKSNQFKFVNCQLPFYGQHNIKRLSNGHYTIFDNGLNTYPHGARAMEFELDQSNKTAKLIWSYTYDKNFNTTGRGNVQRLDNGNTLVAFGTLSSGDICFVVVNPKGEKIIEVKGPPAYRVMNYSSLPFQFNRPVINCFDSAGVKYLDAGAGYKTYKWSNGDSTRIISITKIGSYSVFVPCGDGGYISSEKYSVTNINKSCGLKPSSIKLKKQ